MRDSENQGSFSFENETGLWVCGGRGPRCAAVLLQPIPLAVVLDGVAVALYLGEPGNDQGRGSVFCPEYG